MGEGCSKAWGRGGEEIPDFIENTKGDRSKEGKTSFPRGELLGRQRGIADFLLTKVCILVVHPLQRAFREGHGRSTCAVRLWSYNSQLFMKVVP